MKTEADQDLKKLLWKQFETVESIPEEQPSLFRKFFDTSDTLGVITVVILGIVFTSACVLAVRSFLRIRKGNLRIKLDSSEAFFSTEKISGVIEIEVRSAVTVSELRLRLFGIRTNSQYLPEDDSSKSSQVSFRVIHNEVTILGQNLDLTPREKKIIPFSFFLPQVENSLLDVTLGKDTSWSLEAQAELPGVNLADTVGIRVREGLGNNI